MIFVTVGAQMPFDRLVHVVDEWAGRRGRTDVFAQIGPTDLRPRHLETRRFLEPDAFRARIAEATAIVGHAGMGTIISALQNEKPLLVMPRLSELGETRNEHQVATAKRFLEAGRIMAAFSETELLAGLDEVECFQPKRRIGASASPELIERLRRFVFEP